MVINTNVLAMNANRQLGVTGKSKAKKSEKLSSGYKINRAADDAAGLTISEKLRRQIRGLTQASANTQDGVSFCQVADGALTEVQDILKRCQELATQAANETNTDEDRQNIQMEIEALSGEIDKIHETSTFNDFRVFPDSGNLPNEAPAMVGDHGMSGTNMTVTAGNMTVTFEFLGVDGTPATVVEKAASGTENPDNIKNSAIADFTVKAASSAVSKIAARYPNLFAKSSSADVQIGLELSPEGKGNTLATAGLSMSSGSSSTVASYKLWVDTADYPIEGFDDMSAGQKADLAATISHEMTHLVMFDTVTSGMLGTFPQWFVEGMAQTSSGDNGWLSNRIGPSSSDSDINNYKSQILSMPYGAGYAACMYLGQVASGETAVNSTNIAKGLDKLLTEVANKTHEEGTDSATILDNAIKTVTNGKFENVRDFQNKFSSSSDADSLDFMHKFLNARGTNGAGSILGELNEPESGLFSTISGGYSAGYKVNKDNNWYSNAFGTGYTFPKNLPSSGGSGGGGGNDREGFILQVGSEKDNEIYVKQFNISNGSIFGNMRMDVSNAAGAKATMELVKEADLKISAVRSYYGAMQNRLEHTIRNLDNVVENTTAANSRIRDTDMAAEMVEYSKENILEQAGQAMLAQANQSTQGILTLLQS